MLTNEFDLQTIKHPRAYHFSDDVLYVLYSFESETYLVDFDDVLKFLTLEQAKEFEKSLLANAKNLLQLEEDELDEFLELWEEEKLREISDYLETNHLVLDYLEHFDKNV